MVSLTLMYGVILALMGAVALAAIYYRASSDTPAQSTLVVIALLVLLSYSLFNWVWDPGYIKYWIVPLMAWWLLAGVVLKALSTSRQWSHHLLRGAIVALALASLVANLVWHFEPHRRDAGSDWTAAAQSLQNTQRADLFISLSGHPLDFHIAYFTQRDIVSVPLAAYGAGGDEAAALDLATARANEHRLAGGDLFVYGLEQVGDERRDAYLQALGIDALSPAWTFPGVTVYRATSLDTSSLDEDSSATRPVGW
jgi:hypothetical protein